MEPPLAASAVDPAHPDEVAAALGVLLERGTVDARRGQHGFRLGARHRVQLALASDRPDRGLERVAEVHEQLRPLEAHDVGLRAAS